MQDLNKALAEIDASISKLQALKAKITKQQPKTFIDFLKDLDNGKIKAFKSKDGMVNYFVKRLVWAKYNLPYSLYVFAACEYVDHGNNTHAYQNPCIKIYTEESLKDAYETEVASLDDIGATNTIAFVNRRVTPMICEWLTDKDKSKALGGCYDCSDGCPIRKIRSLAAKRYKTKYIGWNVDDSAKAIIKAVIPIFTKFERHMDSTDKWKISVPLDKTLRFENARSLEQWVKE